MIHQPYSYSPITERPKIEWPDGKKVAFYIGLNVEHFELDKPSTSIYAGTSELKPDPLNHGWRDYGNRVGIWRMIEAMDKYHIRPSVLLNSDVVKHYPQIIEAGVKRNWAWLAHGKNNSNLHTGLDEAQERIVLKEIVDTISQVTGKPVKGWMGPGLTETHNTPRLIKELGLNYVLDWTADDQPFPMNEKDVISVPYSVELNDIMLFTMQGLSGEAFLQLVKDQLDQLYKESEHSGRVLALALHPFVIGQAFRNKYFEKALEYISSHEGVWLATSDEIAEHYTKQIQNK